MSKRDHIHFVTGRLAENALRDVVKELATKVRGNLRETVVQPTPELVLCRGHLLQELIEPWA